ncbi:M28 family peptidase, partial [bacterium]|nr:M28 family peptidase [bacterium]
ARRLDADVIPPLSDYEPFWRRRVPFVFLTCGRSRVYHTPLDTPDLLDLAKIEATARFLAALARDAALAPGKRVYADARDDAGTLATLGELASTLAPFSLDAERAEKTVRELQAAARKRPLSERERGAISSLIIGLEEAFA